MNPILIPTDLSKDSITVLQYGIRLAQKLKLPVQLLHVISSPTLNTVPAMSNGAGFTLPANQVADLEFQIDQAEKKLQKLQKTFNLKFPRSLVIETIVKIGFVESKVMDVIQDQKPSLVILGSSGDDNFINHLMGTIATGIAKETSIPTLLVPENSIFNIPKYFVLASDLSESILNNLKNLTDFASRLGAKIHLLDISENPETVKKYDEKKITEVFKHRANFENIEYSLVLGEDQYKITMDAFKTIDGDVLVIQHDEKNFLSQLFQKDITDKIIFNAQKPVLVY